MGPAACYDITQAIKAIRSTKGLFCLRAIYISMCAQALVYRANGTPRSPGVACAQGYEGMGPAAYYNITQAIRAVRNPKRPVLSEGNFYQYACPGLTLACEHYATRPDCGQCVRL